MFVNRTPLNIAVDKENIEIVKLLFNNKNNDINIKCFIKLSFREEKEMTALHIAVMKENSDIVKLLLKNNKIDVNIKAKINSMWGNQDNIWKKTALHMAIENNNHEIFYLLLENNSIDININEALKIYCGSYFGFQHINDIIRRIGEEEFEKNKAIEKKKIKEKHQYINEKTTLHLAVENNNIDFVKSILNKQIIDVNAICEFENKKMNALKYAIQNGNIEIIKFLLKIPNINIESCLKFALQNRKFEIAKLFLDSNQKIQDIEQLNDILMIAISNKQNEIAQSLIEKHSFDINEVIKDYDDKITLLHFAVINENIEFVKYLLRKQDIDVNKTAELVDFDDNSKIYEESTALHLAVKIENIEMIKILSNCQSIDVNILYQCKKFKIYNSFFCRPKRKCVQKNIQEPEEIVKMTALHIAVKQNNADIVEILLSNKNIDVNIKDDKNMTPIQSSTNDQIKSLISMSINK